MCCFTMRVFSLFFITIFSFGLNRLYPQIPVVIYYFTLSNILAFIILSMFFTRRLPNFVKPNAMHYFSLIGGFIGSLAAMAVFKKFSKDIFSLIQISLSIIWIVAIYFLIIKFHIVIAWFQGILYGQN